VPPLEASHLSNGPADGRDQAAPASRLVERLLADLERLPSLQSVLLRVVQTAADPDTSVADLAAACSLDPAFSARLLRMANSAYYARAVPATSVSAAVNLLGFEVVRSLALARALATPDAGVPLPEDFWHSAATVAVTTRHAARLLGADESAALSIGLLCDVGQALLFRAAPEAYAQLAGTAEPGRLVDEERAWCGTSHGEVSAAALQQMGFPSAMCEAVVRHHEGLSSEPTRPLDTALRVGVLLAQAVEEGDVAEPAVETIEALTDGRISRAAARSIALDAAGEVAAVLVGLH
jgi:putative nucleotidyltransferase with HDIG domain